MYEDKFLENTETDEYNGILKNARIVVPLKHLTNFGRLLEILLNNCQIVLKLKRKNYCVLFAAGADDANKKDDNIIFTDSYNSHD